MNKKPYLTLENAKSIIAACHEFAGKKEYSPIAIAVCDDGGHIIADGGCVYPGDVAKAFGAGAHFVMLGGMLAGHDESEGELVKGENGKLYKSFYGMSSAKAMQEYYGEIAKHRAPEGKEVRVPYRGGLEETVQAILG